MRLILLAFVAFPILSLYNRAFNRRKLSKLRLDDAFQDSQALRQKSRNFQEVDAALRRIMTEESDNISSDFLLKAMKALDTCRTRPSTLYSYWQNITSLPSVDVDSESIKAILSQSIPRAARSKGQKLALRRILSEIRTSGAVEQKMDCGALKLYFQACFTAECPTYVTQVLSAAMKRQNGCVYLTQLDAQSFSIMIKGLGLAGDLDSARAAFHLFSTTVNRTAHGAEAGESEVRVCNVYIDCLLKAAITSSEQTTSHENAYAIEGLGLFDQMLVQGKADSFSLSSVLTYHSTVGNATACEVIWRKAVDSGNIRPHHITCGLMTRALATDDRLIASPPITREALARTIDFVGCYPGDATLKPLMYALGAEHALPREALAVRRDLSASSDASEATLTSLLQGYHAAGRPDLLVQAYALAYGPATDENAANIRGIPPCPALRPEDVTCDVRVLNLLLASAKTLATSSWDFNWHDTDGLVIHSVDQLWVMIKTILRRRVALQQQRPKSYKGKSDTEVFFDDVTVASGIELANAVGDSSFARFLWKAQKYLGPRASRRAFHAFLRRFGSKSSASLSEQELDVGGAVDGSSFWASTEEATISAVDELHEFRHLYQALGASIAPLSSSNVRVWKRMQGSGKVVATEGSGDLRKCIEFPDIDVRAMDELCNAALRLGGVPEAYRALSAVMQDPRHNNRAVVPSLVALTHVLIYFDKHWRDWNMLDDPRGRANGESDMESEIKWISRLLELQAERGHLASGSTSLNAETTEELSDEVLLWAALVAVPLSRGTHSGAMEVLQSMTRRYGARSAAVAQALHIAVLAALDARVPLAPTITLPARRRIAAVLVSGPRAVADIVSAVQAELLQTQPEQRITCTLLDVIMLLEAAGPSQGNPPVAGVPLGVSLLQMLFFESVAARRPQEAGRVVRILERARLVLDVDKDKVNALLAEARVSPAGASEAGSNVVMIRAVLARQWAAQLVGRSLRRAKEEFGQSLRKVRGVDSDVADADSKHAEERE